MRRIPEHVIHALRVCHIYVGKHRHGIHIGLLGGAALVTLLFLGMHPGLILFSEAALVKAIEDIL